MAWRIDRFNRVQNTTQTAAATFATGVEAFDEAWNNVGTFVKNAIRQSNWGDDSSPTGDETRFKVYVERRTGQPMGLHLRYSYPTGTFPNNPEGTHETNDISWTIRFE